MHVIVLNVIGVIFVRTSQIYMGIALKLRLVSTVKAQTAVSVTVKGAAVH